MGGGAPGMVGTGALGSVPVLLFSSLSILVKRDDWSIGLLGNGESCRLGGRNGLSS